MGGSRNFTSEELEPTGIEDEQLSTAPEAVPVPLLWGERKVALKWISRVYNQVAKEAPQARSGKKG
jgi:hypothetical protein